MSIEQLNAKASLDTRDYERGAKRAGDAIKKLGAETNNAAKGFDKGADAAGKASFALTNFSRVAQDAPFGFVAIQNNIGPLIDSFTSLKNTTGSSIAAFKQIISSLIGPAGVGVAISLATSAITYLTKEGFFKGGKAAKEAAEANKEFKSTLESVISDLAQEQVKVDKIVKALEMDILTRKQKVEAISQLQAISPAYFGQLDRENATIENIAKAYSRYNDAVLKRITLKVREKELLDVTEKILELQDKGAKGSLNAGIEEVRINGKIVKARTATIVKQGEYNDMLSDYQKQMQQVVGLTKSEYLEQERLIARRKQLLDEITAASGADPFIKIDNDRKKIKTISDLLAEMRKNIANLRTEELVFFDNTIPQQIDVIRNAIKELISDFGLKPDNRLLRELTNSADFLENRITELNTMKVEPIVQELVIRPRTTEPFIGAPDILKEVIDLTEMVGQATDNMMAGISESIGQGLADIFSGKGSFGDFFRGIFAVIGEGLQSLGKQMIKAAILIKKIRDSLALKPGLALIAGIALVALGGILKNQFGKKEAFATGVRNYGGGVALVGERGPETVLLPRGSSVVPNAQTSAGLGGQQVYISETQIRGQDLLVVYKRATNSRGRTT